MKRQRIVHMTTVHAAQDVRIFVKECRSLAAEGYEVVLVVPAVGSQVIDRVRIKAVAPPRSRWRRMTRTVRDVYRAAVAERADLYHFHDPELIPIGLLMKAQGHRVVYDVHENLPQDIIHSKPYLPRPLRRALAQLASCLETVTARSIDGVVTITEGFAERFPPGKTCVVANYPVLEPHRPIPPPLAERRPEICWIGGFARTRCAHQLVDAIALVRRRQDAVLVVAGGMESVELARELAERPGWSGVDYRGRLARPEVQLLLDRARVAVAVNRFRPDYIDISTNKLFEYMLSGLPLVVSRIPAWERLVNELQCGLVVDSTHPEPIAEAIVWLLDHPTEAAAMGARGRRAVLERYHWAGEEAKLLGFYDRLLNRAA